MVMPDVLQYIMNRECYILQESVCVCFWPSVPCVFIHGNVLLVFCGEGKFDWNLYGCVFRKRELKRTLEWAS